MTSSRRNASFRYRYYEFEDLPFYLDPEYNVNVIIDPDPTGTSFAVDYKNDLILEKLQTVDPELGQLYQSFGKPGSGLWKHNAGFFWLRLPEPGNGTLLFPSMKLKFNDYGVSRINRRGIALLRT